MFVWRCLKCFRYLSNIETKELKDDVTQRTLCPRCRSENKIILCNNGAIVSCAFGEKYKSNLTKRKEIMPAINPNLVILSSVIPLSCKFVKINKVCV